MLPKTSVFRFARLPLAGAVGAGLLFSPALFLLDATLPAAHSAPPVLELQTSWRFPGS
ncbi:hypothetical protein ACUY3S_08870 [Corynebacterium resistens]